MNWLNNFKISVKICLIVALMAVDTIGTAVFASQKMRAMEDANTDIVTRVGKSRTMSVRAARRSDNYVSSAFQLAAHTTDAENYKYYAKTVESRRSYESIMSTVLTNVPESASTIRGTITNFLAVFAACDSAIQFSRTTTTPEQNIKAADRLKAECVPLAESSIAAHVKMVDDLLASSVKASDNLTEAANFSIRLVWISACVGLLVCLVVALWIGINGLARPIADLKSVMQAFARNEMDEAVPGIERGDEVGGMARAVEVFKTNAIEVERLKAGLEEIEKRAVQQRKTEMKKLADDFEGAVGEIIETVSSPSTELEASAGTLTATAVLSQKLTTMVSAASEEASANVQSVASATEELTSSVYEISRQVQESARIANDAVQQAQKTNDRVGELAKAAARIGDVVELSNTIAGQTNFLALNATIEAARAGEAGRSFAVVASEVKALAEQTARATGYISQQINGIQAATHESVGAIKEIGDTIGRMSEIASTIASAVEEQGAATQEISRNVQQAAQGTMQVSSNITDVQRGANETGSASSQVLSAARSLSRDSNRLKLEVGKFLNTVRAA